MCIRDRINDIDAQVSACFTPPSYTGIKPIYLTHVKNENTDAEILIQQANVCFDAGAEYVLVEGAEFIKSGVLKVELLNELKDNLDLGRVMFELSGTWISGTTSSEVYQLKSFLIKEFGSNVNIANVLPENVWETEAMRVGLSVGGPPDSVTNESI